ncbi:hypothetical protein HMI55_005250 [Coelomomyces lativittatus]|nr:hypothetical protein HMI55_005250 [Coelomomyces lativittatus]
MKVVNEFLNQLLIQRTLLKNTTTTTTNGINRYPMSPSDTIRRNQHGLLKQRSNSHF